MSNMRAKVRISNIEKFDNGTEKLSFHGVAKDGPYPPDGSDEDNSFAKFSPSLNLELQLANPALHGKFAVGDKFYLDFTKID